MNRLYKKMATEVSRVDLVFSLNDQTKHTQHVFQIQTKELRIFTDRSARI